MSLLAPRVCRLDASTAKMTREATLPSNVQSASSIGFCSINHIHQQVKMIVVGWLAVPT